MPVSPRRLEAWEFDIKWDPAMLKSRVICQDCLGEPMDAIVERRISWQSWADLQTPDFSGVL
jgi:hypothetical protein